uniref:Pre-mRNA-splicing factor Syf1/CRNKL1-like C-terminal HAT-repeats domain-containing protein n=1 Tax=Panagrolaimus superbus TaxID=310955 RepID=A0A914YWZ7_9BILA
MLLTVRCLTKNGSEWLLSCADKQELPEYKNGKWSKNKLYQGYVYDFGKNKIPNVEVFPGVQIAIEKPEQSVHLDDLIVFKVVDSDDDKSSFKVVNVIREAEAKAELKDEETDDDEEEDDQDSEMQAIKDAMSKLTKGGNIFNASAFTKNTLQSAKESLQTEAKKAAQKRGRNESITSIKTQSDDEVDQEEAMLDDNARILHKEKILSGLEKSSELNDDTDYNRLVLSNPHSSEAWISYMVYQAQDGNIEEARKVAENALNTINPREEQERINLFTAYLNLEVASGDEKSLKAVFERALGAFDAFEIHKRLANIYLSTKKFDDLEKLYNVMLKKFGNHIRDVWSLYGAFLYKQNRQAEGRELMKRALNIIPKKHHLEMLCRFANFEYAHGDIERGKTMLEKAVAAASNRGDIWNVYIDKAIKYQNIDDARLLFERAITNKLGMHTMKNLFQKWQDFEKLRGDEEHLLKVNEKAVQFTKNLKKDIMDAQADEEENGQNYH